MKDYIKLKNGSVLHLLPISQIQLQKVTLATEARFKADGEPLEPPTYDDGLGTFVAWDKSSVEKDGSDKEKEDWGLHENAKTRLEFAKEEAAAYLIFVEGTKALVTRNGSEVDLVIDDTTDEWEAPKGWLKRCERMGLELSESGSDLKFEYLNTQAPDLETRRDIAGACVTLTMAGVISEEGLAATEAAFRSQMEQASQEAGSKVAAVLEEVDGVSETGKSGEGALGK